MPTRFWIVTGGAVCIAFIAGSFALRGVISPVGGAESRRVQPPASAWTSETILRKQAIKVVRPEFPISAIISRSTGVAVAKVYLDRSGHVSQVEVLRSPTPAISGSMSAALSHWVFSPPTAPDGRPLLLSGKISFYFEIQGNKAEVLDPANAGYVGRWPLDSNVQRRSNTVVGSGGVTVSHGKSE